jgi:proteasome lid subunit RPN8/RPN11
MEQQMRELKITRAVYDEMLASALKHKPIEACGLLGGKGNDVTLFVGMTNADNAEEHFTFVPEEQFAAIKKFRALDLKMLGIWHSHPASPARMSEEDLKLAYTADVAYVILSLLDASSPNLKAFEVQDGKSCEIELKIEEDDK